MIPQKSSQYGTSGIGYLLKYQLMSSFHGCQYQGIIPLILMKTVSHFAVFLMQGRRHV